MFSILRVSVERQTCRNVSVKEGGGQEGGAEEEDKEKEEEEQQLQMKDRLPGCCNAL